MRAGLRSVAVPLIVAVLVGGALTAPAIANHPGGECPPAIPINEVRKGMFGTGHTVADGRTRTTFQVEVLGVLKDGLGPGRDMIVAEASGPVIDQAGGIWYGISGSPVFVGNRLLGSVSFGLSFGPSAITGLTPAPEMYKILDYPRENSQAMQKRRVRLSPAMRKRIAYASGSRMGTVPGSMTQLKLPVSISGAPAQAIDKVADIIAREKAPLIPYAGSSAVAPSQTTSSGQLHPGDNIAAAISYGDLTFAATGTTTFVCRGQVVAFGHEFFWTGASLFGANAATTLAIIEDPFFGSFELATVDETVGKIEQDRRAGIAGPLGLVPATIPITSTVNALNTNRTREGATQVVLEDEIPFLAWLHTYGNILFTMDQYSEGSANLAWTITGTRASGGTWSVTRDNMYTSDFGIADESAYELAGMLYTLLFNDFEEVGVTSVDVDATADDEVRQYTLADVLVSKDGTTFEDKRRVRAQPGQTIYLRALLSPREGGEDKTVDLTIVLPDKMRNEGLIEIASGYYSPSGEICLYEPQFCVDEQGNKIESFDDLLMSLQNRPKNNELLAKLRSGRRGRVKASDSELLDQVVVGRARVRVRLPGGRRGGGEVVTAEPGPRPRR
jgi:hypothetical protein